MGKTAYSIAMQQMGDLIEKANLGAKALEEVYSRLDETEQEIEDLETTKADLTYVDDQLSGTVKKGDFFFNVKDYGAIGDGVADDRASIREAIDAAVAAGGGTVFLPAGTYLVSGVITLRSKITLSGVGFNSIIKAKDNYSSAGTSPIIWAADEQSDMCVENLTIDGNGANQSGTANILGVGAYRATRYTLRNCLIKETYGMSTLFSNSKFVLVDGNRIEKTYNMRIGITLTSDMAEYFNSYSVISNNIITGVMADGITVTGAVNGHIAHVDVVGNNIYNCGYMGNNVDGAAVYMNYTANCTIDGNVIDEIGGNGIDVYIGRNIVVSDNVVSDVDRAGIMFDSVTYSQVTGNNITNCVQKGAANAFNSSHRFLSGIYAGDNCNHLIYSGNVSTDNQTVKTQAYGFLSKGPSNSYFVIQGNDFSNNGTSAIQLDSPVSNCQTFKNTGYNPVGNVTAPTLPASGATLINPFPFTSRIYITGTGVTGININGVNVGVTGTAVANGTLVILEPGETIRIVYTTAPNWVWFGM